MSDLRASAEGSSEPVRRGPRAWNRSSIWLGIGFIVYLLFSIHQFQDVLKRGFGSSAMTAEENIFLDRDVVFEAWLVARNAYTLSREPLELFDTPHCHPAEKTLTYGIPMITMGLLAIPVSLFTPNPAIAYNLSILLIWFFSALAMYLLVKEWTGVPAAGVIAGILYAFSPIKLGGMVGHPSVWDSCWMVFAMFFSQRLFARGLWRDAIGLAVACSLQIAASFYPLIASALLAPFYLAWLLVRYRLRHVRTSQLVFVATVAVAAAAICFGPYLETRSSGAVQPRTAFFFAEWVWMVPGEKLFFGWATILLAAVGLLVPRKDAAPRLCGDPRWLLLIGALFVTVIAMGPTNNQLVRLVFGAERPFEIPNFYEALASVIPGLDTIRVVMRLMVALQIVLCILAGLGAAWLIRFAENWGPGVAAVLLLVGAVTTSTVHPAPSAVAVRVDPSEIEFFEDLAALGNDGPILELPLPIGQSVGSMSVKRILATQYHRRRTYTCFGSYHPGGREAIAEILARLPERAAQRELRELGFTTLILYHAAGVPAQRIKYRLQHHRNPDVPRVILSTKTMTAYELGS